MLSLAISDALRTGLAPFLRKNVLAAHKLLQPALSELSIALVDGRTMSRLHAQFMGIRGPTDVLTFELEHNRRHHVTSGEIIVCVPYARKIASRNGVLLRHEMLLYCIHGMLHLCGHDDRTQGGFTRMHRREDEILGRLGIGPVFARAAAAGSTKKRRSKGTLR